MEGKPCEIEQRIIDEYRVCIADGGPSSYTDMTCYMDTPDGGLSMVAGGESSAEFYPKFCPFCGRQIRLKWMCQYGTDGLWKPKMLEELPPCEYMVENDEEEEESEDD